MQALELEMFTSGVQDIEAAQYRILAAAGSVAQEFHRTRLYPGLAEVIDLVSALETINGNREQYKTQLPKKLTGVDFEKKTLKFDAVPADAQDIEKMFALIEWALPHIKKLTDEGVAMFDFVTQDMSIDVVGIMPIYRDEGYALIPDIAAGLVHVLRYQLSIFSDKSENYRALKTEEIETREIIMAYSAPENIKLELIKGHSDLPNPATFMVDTELDFPFEQTILPVAKRALMKELIS